jgi:uncharacterized membrane protein
MAASRERRLAFLDGLRGIAIIIMIVNHTSRDWTARSLGWSRVYLTYGSVLHPAAIFLFLVGFCLPLSFQRAAPEGWAALVTKYGRRGLLIIGGGLLLNLLVFPENPVWAGDVLMTIGFCIAVLGPLTPRVRRPQARIIAVVIAVLIYLAFAGLEPRLQRWSDAHRTLAEIWFLDFPPWPWISVALIGLAAGWTWLDMRARGPDAEIRFFRWTAVGGVGCLAAYGLWEWRIPTTPRFGFRRDFLLNQHWTPRGMTVLMVVGGVAVLLAATYWIMEIKKLPLPWLVILGQTALMLYFVHQVIEMTIVSKLFGWRTGSWVVYWGANALLIVLCVYLGRAWLTLKRVIRERRLRAASSGAPAV